MQKLAPDEYARLELHDQWIEDEMQQVEARWLVKRTEGNTEVLELGWGSGIVAKALAAAGRRVTVIEGAGEFALEAAKVRGVVGVHTMFEDYEPHHPFDCVIASFVLEHVADPVKLLRRMRGWAPKLIAVIGNSESWHRRLAVKMGLQESLDSLSKRDQLVGHHRVYSLDSLHEHLYWAGWLPRITHGLMFKPLPNGMLKDFNIDLVRAMCEVEVAPTEAANIGIVCERV